mmetsp:Transcript_34007/g.62230  ORF Transcript_34007/g.62230 Transcript_34007/m.62230 type:complete len:150 (-) Transcript_34007:181-630(-)
MGGPPIVTCDGAPLEDTRCSAHAAKTYLEALLTAKPVARGGPVNSVQRPSFGEQPVVKSIPNESALLERQPKPNLPIEVLAPLPQALDVFAANLDEDHEDKVPIDSTTLIPMDLYRNLVKAGRAARERGHHRFQAEVARNKTRRVLRLS